MRLAIAAVLFFTFLAAFAVAKPTAKPVTGAQPATVAPKNILFAAKPTQKPCSPLSHVVVQKIGGKVIKQKKVQIQTKSGCIFVLEGGNANQYVNAHNCGRCRSSTNRDVCAHALLSRSSKPKCMWKRGIDCKTYLVDKVVNSNPCT